MRHRNVQLETVLSDIENQTDYLFLYNGNQVDATQNVSVNVKNKPVNELLNELFADSPVSYVVEGTHIVLQAEGADVKETPPAEVRQAITITGKVTDTDGDPLPGVSIIIKGGSQQGTASDTNGAFSLQVPSENTTLVFSYIGFETQEVLVGNRRTLNISLREDIREIEEVVVVGYGTRVKGALTGAVSKTDSKPFETRPIVDPLNALQGVLPGVTVIRGSTRPGYDQVSVQIRGYSSMGGFQPLILIDGLAGDLSLLNPADILDVTVLKDAAASIYGARASDGVILVTTKKGKSGKPVLSYSTNVGVKIPHFLKKMSPTYEVIDMFQEAMYNVGLPMASQEVVNKIKSRNAPPEPTGSWLYGYETFPAFLPGL